jgi:hypothetical protein
MSSATLAQLQFADFPVLMPGEPAARAPRLDPEAPALAAMTDLRCAPAVSARAGASIEDALQLMKQAGTHFAFVLDAGGALLGSVTTFDIQGEKPVRVMLGAGAAQASFAWRDVQVQHIMEPVANWRVLEFSQVERQSAAQVAELLAQAGLRHLVVVEPAADGRARQVRGLFSAARLEALLGPRGWTPAVGRGMTSVMARAAEADAAAGYVF